MALFLIGCLRLSREKEELEHRNDTKLLRTTSNEYNPPNITDDIS